MNEHLGVDLLLRAGDFSGLPTGDCDTVEGVACLRQDLVLRLGTPRGDHWRHPTHGLDLQRFLHLEDAPVHRLDFCRSVELALEQDPRVTPGSATCEVLGWEREALRFRASCLPIGLSHPLNLVLGFDLSSITLAVVHGN
jgi:hypothetical protein